MKVNESEGQESYECGECGKQFSTERGRDSHVEQVHGRPYHDGDLLRELYVNQGLSSMDIADRFGVAYNTITGQLRKNGIEVRSTKRSHRLKSPEQLQDPDTLRELYHGEELRTAEIAERVGVSQATVTLWMQRHGIEAEERAASGADHWKWSDETESLDYGRNWYYQRKKARSRDDNTCQVCGHSPDSGNLDVHHIQPIKTFETPENSNTLDNLITLCRTCHRKWEGVPLLPEGVAPSDGSDE